MYSRGSSTSGGRARWRTAAAGVWVRSGPGWHGTSCGRRARLGRPDGGILRHPRHPRGRHHLQTVKLQAALSHTHLPATSTSRHSHKCFWACLKMLSDISSVACTVTYSIRISAHSCGSQCSKHFSRPSINSFDARFSCKGPLFVGGHQKPIQMIRACGFTNEFLNGLDLGSFESNSGMNSQNCEPFWFQDWFPA